MLAEQAPSNRTRSPSCEAGSGGRASPAPAPRPRARSVLLPGASASSRLRRCPLFSLHRNRHNSVQSGRGVPGCGAARSCRPTRAQRSRRGVPRASRVPGLRRLTVLADVTALNVETGLEPRSHWPVTSCDRLAGGQGHQSGSGTSPCKLTTHSTVSLAVCHALMNGKVPKGTRPPLSAAATALAWWGGMGDGALPCGWDSGRVHGSRETEAALRDPGESQGCMSGGPERATREENAHTSDHT